MEAIRELPFAWAFGLLFLIVMLRANGTYWLGRAAESGGRRSQRLQKRLDGKAMERARDIMATWGVAAVPLSFLTIGVQTAINFSAGAMRMPLRRYVPAVTVGCIIWATIYATAGTVLFTVIWNAISS